ncbi:MAG: matrixin family metalloprotease, partial [Cyanobacteria bacterium P01_F01_bin.86]
MVTTTTVINTDGNAEGSLIKEILKPQFSKDLFSSDSDLTERFTSDALAPESGLELQQPLTTPLQNEPAANLTDRLTADALAAEIGPELQQPLTMPSQSEAPLKFDFINQRSTLDADLDSSGDLGAAAGESDSSLSGTHFSGCSCSWHQDFSTDGTVAESDFTAYGGSFKFAQPNGKGTRTTVTYSYTDLFNGEMNGVTNAEMKAAIEESFATWAEYVPIDFVEIKDTGPKTRDNLDAADIRIGNDDLGGRGGTLGRANMTTSPGEFTSTFNFDNNESWGLESDGFTFDIHEVALHEIGHTLGLGHESSGKDAIMNPSLQNRFDGPGTMFLLQDDINGIQSIYGKGKGSVKPLNGSAPKPKPDPKPEPEPDPTPEPEPDPTPEPDPDPTPGPNPKPNNVIRGNNRNNTLKGTNRDETILGLRGNDTLRGVNGNDRLEGGAGRDRLEGGTGNDKLFGGQGRDQLFGGNGNDLLRGNKGTGKNEKDVLRGGGGADTFVLGDKSNVFYNDRKANTLGASDYALIQDFNRGQGDVIRLKGKASNYRIGNSPVENGKAIFLKTRGQDELIAVVQGNVNNLNLKGNAFQYVNKGSSNPSPNPNPSPAPSPNPNPQSETDRFDQAVLKLVNEERTDRGLNALKFNNNLDQAADKHAKDMAENDFFGHKGSNGSSLDNRIGATGYNAKVADQNIAGGQRSAQQVVNDWMNNPTTRNRLLNPNVTDMGLGYKSLNND